MTSTYERIKEYLDSEGNEYPVGDTSVTGGSASKKRKPRSDKGVKRPLNDWQRLVKAVSKEYDLPYNKAPKMASQLKQEGITYRDFE